MALSLVTGRPGAGKTLWMISHVKARAEREQRPVYYHGINDLALDWHPLIRGEDWHTEVPDGAIVVLDEVQKVMAPAGTGQRVPDHIAALETHRHRGLDVYVATQHPMMAHSHIRRLSEDHYHVSRMFGLERARVHHFPGKVQADPDKGRAGSVATNWPYPKDAYRWYKSAEIHTHKARIPARVWFLLAAPLLIGGLIYTAYHYTRPGRIAEQITGTPPGTASALAVPFSSAGPARAMTAEEYYAAYTPRIPGLAHTAPRYDEIAAPQSAPVPAGCLASARQCICYTHQGTRLGIEDATCRQIAEHGYFDDTQPRTADRGAPVPQSSESRDLPVQGTSREAGEIVSLPGPPRPLEENPIIAKPLPELRNGGLTTG